MVDNGKDNQIDKSVMEQVAQGRDLFIIHRKMGLIRKYYVDLLRIQRLIIL